MRPTRALSWGADMGAVWAELHADHGTRLLTGPGVAGLVGTGRVEAVELTDGTRLPADVVVVGIGATPNVGWLAHSGVALGNGVLTDARGATNIPDVVAVGDCAAWSATAERHVRIEHWTTALEQPATAVATLLGAGEPVPTPVPYFWSDQYGAPHPVRGLPPQGRRRPRRRGQLRSAVPAAP